MTPSRPLRVGAIAAAALLMAGLSACSTGADAPSTSSGADGIEQTHLTVQLDFQVRGLHSVLFVGKEKGFFEEEGITVDDILTGKSSGETLRLVAQGQGDIGVADLPTLVVARSQDVPVKAIAAINQNTPMAMCSLVENEVLESPADLEGLTVGVQASGSTYVFFKALLAANDLEPSDVTELTVNPPYESYLLTGQVDSVPCYRDAEITILGEHAGGIDKLSILDGRDWGYEAYGTGLFASDDFLAENPDAVEAFMRGYVKAFQYTMDNPQEAAEITAASAPELAGNVDLYMEQLQVGIDDLFTSETTDEIGLGAMADERWQETIDLLAEQGVIEAVPTVDDVRDSTFVDAANAD